MTTWSDVYDELMGIAGRVPVLTFSGTWARPGEGYPSDAVRMAGSRVVEVAVPAPWSFGPVGGPDPFAPSYRQSVSFAVEWAIDWLLRWRGPFILCGYSQGAEAASRVFEMAREAPDVCGQCLGGVTFGNPCRESRSGYRGIAEFRIKATPSTWLDFVNGGDMYTEVPDDRTGAIMTQVYNLATNLQVNDPVELVRSMVRHVVALLEELFGTSDLGGAADRVLQDPKAGLALVSSRLLYGGLSGGVVSAARALVILLRFLAQEPPTKPHITYLESGAVHAAAEHIRALSG